MKIQKPAWSFTELNKNYERWMRLIDETDSHEPDCQCKLCMECFALGEFLEMFSEDEHAIAVIEINKSRK